MDDPNYPKRQILARFDSSSLITENDGQRYFTTRQVLLAMEMYAGTQLMEATRRQNNLTEMRWSYGSGGIVIGVMIWLLLQFIFRPAQWFLINLPGDQRIIIYGVLTVLFCILSGGVAAMIATRVWHYRNYVARKRG